MKHPFIIPWTVTTVFAVGFLMYIGWQYFSTFDVSLDTLPEVALNESYYSYDEALSRAREEALTWRDDAELSKIYPFGETIAREGVSTWRVIFTSVKEPGTGYVIDIRSGAVIHTEEASYDAGGAAMPTNAKTAADVIAEVRMLEGRANAVIEGVEALYNTDDHMWYWGVMTDMGTISIRMERE